VYALRLCLSCCYVIPRSAPFAQTHPALSYLMRFVPPYSTIPNFCSQSSSCSCSDPRLSQGGTRSPPRRACAVGKRGVIPLIYRPATPDRRHDRTFPCTAYDNASAAPATSPHGRRGQANLLRHLPPPQARGKNDATVFPEEKQARCPQGQTSVKWTPGRDVYGDPGTPRLFLHKNCKPIGACAGYSRARLFFPRHFIPAPFFNEGTSLVGTYFL
jgi:hypothetical protein